MKYIIILIVLFQGFKLSSQDIRYSRLKSYVLNFNANDPELYKNSIPNEAASDFLKNNIPLFECPDINIERIYYFRWWTYRKHIRKTPEGFVITEFLPNVVWAGKFNTISCPAGHHIYEGRWLRDPKYIQSYCYFWLTPEAEPRKYSFWAADAMYQFFKVHPNDSFTIKIWPGLEKNFLAWDGTHRGKNGLYWQIDDRDGMEFTIGGIGGREFPCLLNKDGCKNFYVDFYRKDTLFTHQYRPTINSYMFADARALAFFAGQLNKNEKAAEYHHLAESIRQNTMKKLWHSGDSFFEVLQNDTTKGLVNVKELLGYIPWYFNLPGNGYETAWKYVMDTNTFLAPYGLTTADQSHPLFLYPNKHSCLWNGYIWPFASSQTLKGMANLLQNYTQDIVSVNDYVQLLSLYATSHFLIENNKKIDWIDESQHPHTGDWFTRRALINVGDRNERGRDYNHSSFVDLIITGLCGIVPQDQNRLVIQPLIPEGWDYFCLENVRYKNKDVSIFWDKTGKKYKKGKGLMIFVDSVLKKKSDKLTTLVIEL